MPGPVVGPCGHEHEPACPPTPAAVVNGGNEYWTRGQIEAHGHLNYHKGIRDLWEKISAVIEDPAHGWSEGEMARAIRAVAGQ